MCPSKFIFASVAFRAQSRADCFEFFLFYFKFEILCLIFCYFLALLPRFLATTTLAGIVVNVRPHARMRMTITVGQTVSSRESDCKNIIDKYKLVSRSSVKIATMKQFHFVLLPASKSESHRRQLTNTLAVSQMLEFTVSFFSEKLRVIFSQAALTEFARPVPPFAVRQEFPTTVSSSSSAQASSALMELPSRKR